MDEDMRLDQGPLLDVEPEAVLSSIQHFDPHAVITISNPGYYTVQSENQGAQLTSLESELLQAAAHGESGKIEDLIKRGVNIAAKDSDGQTALQLAAREDHSRVVKLLLHQHCESNIVNATDDKGWCALHEASRQGYEDVVKELLDHGAGTSIRTKNSGDTALHKACLNGREGVVRLLLDKAVDVNTRTEIGETPLHIAARNGYGEIVQLLLDKADVTAKDKDGWTPLYSATNFGKESVIELLLQKMNQSQIAEQTKNGETALFRAAENNNENVVFLFLKREADLVLPFLEEDADLTGSPIESGMCHTSERDTQMICDFLVTRMSPDDGLRGKHFQEVGLWAARNHIAGQDTGILMDRALNEARSQGNEIKLEEKLLYAAAFCGCEGTVDWLLGQRARKSEMKTRHLEASMRLAAWNGHTRPLKYLLKESASPDESLKNVVNGETLLHVAARNGNEAVVKLLLDRGAEILARTKTNKETALHLAASNGHIMVVTELLGRKDRPLLIKARTADGETALSLAARKALSPLGRKEDSMVVELLLNNMTAVDFGDNSDIADETLTWAAQKNHTTMVRKLLAKEPSDEAINGVAQKTGVHTSAWTALDWAAFCGNPVVVWWLLANGVSMNNKSALWIAEARLDQISSKENSEIRKEGTIGAKGPRDMETDKNGKEDETGGVRINDFERVQHESDRPKEGHPEEDRPEENHPEDGEQQDGGREEDEREKSDQLENLEKEVTEHSGLNAMETNEGEEENQTKEGNDETVATVMKVEDTENERSHIEKMGIEGENAEQISKLAEEPEGTGDVFSSADLWEEVGEGTSGEEVVVAEEKMESLKLSRRSSVAGVAVAEEEMERLKSSRRSSVAGVAVTQEEMERLKSSRRSSVAGVAVTQGEMESLKTSERSSCEELVVAEEKMESLKTSAQPSVYGGPQIPRDEKAGKNEIVRTRPQKKEKEKPAADKRKSQSEYQRYKLTLDMLKDPPPVLEQSDLRKSYEEPAVSDLREGQIECCEKFSATIVDFYLKEDRWGLLRRSPKVSEVLYEYGAEKIMSRARKDLQRINLEAAKKRDYVREDLQFRWIHLPANNMEWMQDLVRKLYKDRQEEPDDYCTLRDFIRRSWYELPESLSKAHFMKPACLNERMTSRKKYRKAGLGGEKQPRDGRPENEKMRDTHAKLGEPIPAQNKISQNERARDRETAGPTKADSPDEEFEQRSSDRIALYMPYLTFATNAAKCTNETYQKLIDAYKEKVIHGSRTLDQFYYHSLSSTKTRDFDQVVTRYIETKPKEMWEQDGCTILRVDQLWLWAIDEETIITSSTHRTDGMEDQVIEQICTYLREQIVNEKGRSSPTSVDEMSRLIPNFCISFISQSTTKVERYNTFESALQIFRNSINEKAEQEARLFREFTENIDQKRDRDRDSEWRKLYIQMKCLLHKFRHMLGLEKKSTEDGEAGPYESISVAAHLLEEVKDIRDELNILRCLLLHQKTVWDSLDSERFSKNRWRGTKDMIDEIEEMDKAAERIQGSVNALLDLDQNEVNIVEAQKSSKQGTVVLVFTIVTIAFLPMSFLTSLFALNITSFQHQSGTLVYEPGWIFPLIFGPSTAISVPLIIFAMNVNRMVNMFKRSKPGSPPRGQTLPPPYTQSGGQGAGGGGNMPRGNAGVRSRPQSKSSGSLTKREELDWN